MKRSPKTSNFLSFKSIWHKAEPKNQNRRSLDSTSLVRRFKKIYPIYCTIQQRPFAKKDRFANTSMTTRQPCTCTKEEHRQQQQHQDNKSSIAGYAAWFLRQEYFPCIASNGAVYTKAAGTTGAASVKTRKFYTYPAALTKHLKEHFPQGCVSIAGPPLLRASKYKKIGKTV
jgi:hypothetical protein